MSPELPEERTLLIVDDDGAFRTRLGQAMTERGFQVSAVANVRDGVDVARLNPPAFAVLDLRLDDGNGMQVVEALRRHRPDCRMVILTGYGNIASAVSAVKAGAVDYLPKPADADMVMNALLGGSAPRTPEPEAEAEASGFRPMSADRVRWEHITRVYELCGRNVSETARQLGMHRRTLQRILAKRAPK